MERLFNKFFKDKKVLITGHTGFIGSWLSIWLIELGADVIGYALPPYTEKDNFVVTNLQERITNIIGDVRDFSKLYEIYKQYKPEIIFHLAAQPLVRTSYEIPKVTYDVNVGGTVNVFEIFRQNINCKVLIHVSTDKCYENKESFEGYKENDRLGGYDPYSSSKACSELIVSAYRQSFFKSNLNYSEKKISSVRCGNVIGGGDWQKDRLIPDCMRAIKDNQEIIIRNHKSIRPWQHVLEPIRGFLMLSMKMWNSDKKFSGAWNFGPEKSSVFSVEEIVKKVIEYIGKGGYKSITTEKSDNLHETEILVLDCAKSNKILGWKPAINIDETIKLVCDWYMKENIDYDFDVKQIISYIKKVKQ